MRGLAAILALTLCVSTISAISFFELVVEARNIITSLLDRDWIMDVKFMFPIKNYFFFIVEVKG